MAWLWDSWEEYVKAVRPRFVRPGLLRISHREPWFETESHLFSAVRKLQEAASSLSTLGFTGNDRGRILGNAANSSEARQFVMEALYAGEELLVYHKRLALSDAADGFLHQNDFMEHWDRYEKTGRIGSEIHQLVPDLNELLEGFQEFAQREERFILGDVDLPDQLEADFRLARNLFSVGFDEVALLIAGRGLEGVLRKIADAKKIRLDVKGKTTPASEADLYDLIEAMYQIRWKTKGTRLITPETKALLHYLRTLRNSAAHASLMNKAMASPRETAAVVAQTANRLWAEVSTTRSRLAPTTVQKTW
jgi:hypothetical protein